MKSLFLIILSFTVYSFSQQLEVLPLHSECEMQDCLLTPSPSGKFVVLRIQGWDTLWFFNINTSKLVHMVIENSEQLKGCGHAVWAGDSTLLFSTCIVPGTNPYQLKYYKLDVSAIYNAASLQKSSTSRANPIIANYDGTKLNLVFPNSGPTEITITYSNGKKILKRKSSGSKFEWDLKDDSGKRVSSGIVFIQVLQNGKTYSKTVNL